MRFISIMDIEYVCAQRPPRDDPIDPGSSCSSCGRAGGGAERILLKEVSGIVLEKTQSGFLHNLSSLSACIKVYWPRVEVLAGYGTGGSNTPCLPELSELSIEGFQDKFSYYRAST